MIIHEDLAKECSEPIEPPCMSAIISSTLKMLLYIRNRIIELILRMESGKTDVAAEEAL